MRTVQESKGRREQGKFANNDSTRDEAGQIDLVAPVDGTDLIREVDRFGTVRYRNSDGLLHREDGPAVECSYGTREWCRNGLLHREDGPAYERPDGTREWWLGGKLHREGGPAIEWADGDRFWCRHGKLHREDGPAVEQADGTREWYLDGKQLSKDEFEARKPAAHQG